MEATTPRTYADFEKKLVEENTHEGYLSELLSYSLERLSKEPELLKTESDRVRREMQDVAIRHYSAFIDSADAIRSIRKEITDIDNHLDSLVEEIPQLTLGCSSFLESGQSTAEKRRLNKTLVANQATLLDLLEIPQLMDTCVRNGNYDEALDLEAFVSKLATVHAKLPVVQALAEEVAQATQAMLGQLLQRLRSNIQLPECLRVIGYLRRLAAFSELDMRVQFLRCRDAWVTELLSDLCQQHAPSASSPSVSSSRASASLGSYEFLKRLTDLHRVQLFDVVTQYRAIFADDLLPSASAGGARGGGGGDAGWDTEFTAGTVHGDGGLLFSWATFRLGLFLQLLGRSLEQLPDGGALASVLEHAMYCGMSLGRVGLDFRPLLPPLFEDRIFTMFDRNLAAACVSFHLSFDSHRWLPLPSMSGLGLSKFGGGGGTSSSGSHLEGRADDVSPPYALMEHPPLAAFVNGVLNALNELRHCAPLSLRSSLSSRLQAALHSVADTLLAHHSARISSSIARGQEAYLFLALCRAFVEVVCPYVALCFAKCVADSPHTALDTKAVCQQLSAVLSSRAVRGGGGGAEPGEGEGGKQQQQQQGEGVGEGTKIVQGASDGGDADSISGPGGGAVGDTDVPEATPLAVEDTPVTEVAESDAAPAAASVEAAPSGDAEQGSSDTSL